MTTTYRQGDILFVSSESPIDTKQTTAGALEIAQGEVTGHAHVLHADGIEFDSDRDGLVSALNLPDGGTLRHDEHAPIDLPPGSYRIRRQREYTYNQAVSADD